MFDSSFSMRHIFILARYWLGSSLRNSWESQARPPLPCHLLMWSNRYLDALFQSQARPPLPCHTVRALVMQGRLRISISGETTAPLPQRIGREPGDHFIQFQSQARPPLPCHRGSDAGAIRGTKISISGETTAPLPPSCTLVRLPTMWRINLRR